jgi:hypothetical protein
MFGPTDAIKEFVVLMERMASALERIANALEGKDDDYQG